MALLHEINNGTQRLSVSSTGQVKINNAFTFPTADGTENYVLKTDGSGTVNWQPDANTGTVTGTGTAGRVAYWTSGTNIASADAFRFDGTNVAIGGAIVTDRKLAIYNTNASNELQFIGADYTNIYSETDSTMAVEVIGDGALLLATKGGNLTIATGGLSTFTGSVIGKSIIVGPAASLNTPAGVSGTLQFGNGNTAFVTGSADAYIYKNQSALGTLPVGSLTFQLRSDSTGGAFAFVGQQTPIPLLIIDNTGLTTIKRTGITGAAKADMEELIFLHILDIVQQVEVKILKEIYILQLEVLQQIHSLLIGWL